MQVMMLELKIFAGTVTWYSAPTMNTTSYFVWLLTTANSDDGDGERGSDGDGGDRGDGGGGHAHHNAHKGGAVLVFSATHLNLP